MVFAVRLVRTLDAIIRHTLGPGRDGGRWHVSVGDDGEFEVGVYDGVAFDVPYGVYIYWWSDKTRSIGFYSRTRILLLWRAKRALRKHLNYRQP